MLYLLTWTATGLVTGWLVRTLLRTRRDFGLAGDLTTGCPSGALAPTLRKIQPPTMPPFTA